MRLFVWVVDRPTTIGKMINAYLTEEAELDDRAVHLLFSANRWEAASVHFLLYELKRGLIEDTTGQIKYSEGTRCWDDGRL